MTIPSEALEGFEPSRFEADGSSRVVWRAGAGPCVIVIAEIPGITPKVVEFARRVVAAGMSVSLPHLFGDDGREPTNRYVISSMARACVSREFATLATGRSSPVTTWLRALARAEHARCGGPGVGVVGMCFTGGFALGMMADAPVVAPVLSQPSLPLPLGARRSADLGCSAAEVASIRQKVAGGACVLGLRFSGDKKSPQARFDTLRSVLGDGFIGVELDSSRGNPYGHRPGAHSVLTEDLIDREGSPTMDALAQVLAFLAERLDVGAAS